MKILLVSNMYPSVEAPHFGTFVRQFEEGLDHIESIDIDKIVITKKKSLFLKVLAYITFSIKIIYKCNFQYKKYDIIYVHYLNHTLFPFFFVQKRKLRKFILNAHGSDVFPEESYTKILSSLSSKILKYATKIVVPSEYFRAKVSQKFDIELHKIFVSPSGGVDTKKFKPSNNNNSQIIIGFLSRIDPGKRWDLLIESAKILRDYNYSFKVLIGGGGSQEVTMLKMIEKNNLENLVEPLGYIAGENVPKFFKKIDVFVFPSERKGESLGLVNLEALASGVPVIGYNNGALREFITEDYNGFIYSNNNAQILATKLIEYFNLSSKERKQLSSNARSSIKDYRHKVISIKLYDMLKSVD